MERQLRHSLQITIYVGPIPIQKWRAGIFDMWMQRGESKTFLFPFCEIWGNCSVATLWPFYDPSVTPFCDLFDLSLTFLWTFCDQFVTILGPFCYLSVLVCNMSQTCDCTIQGRLISLDCKRKNKFEISEYGSIAYLTFQAIDFLFHLCSWSWSEQLAWDLHRGLNLYWDTDRMLQFMSFQFQFNKLKAGMLDMWIQWPSPLGSPVLTFQEEYSTASPDNHMNSPA